MPRDPSGNYTLPTPENPVVTGTVITADDFNTTMDDIAAELTDSWSRSGKGGLQSPVLLDDGTQAAPALAFTSETGTGLYRSAAGVLRAAILGTWRLLLNATGLQVNGNISATGTLGITGAATFSSDVTAPSLKSGVADSASAVGFTANTTSAYTTSGAKLLSLKNNGVEKFAIDKDGTVTVGNVGSSAKPAVNEQTSAACTLSNSNSVGWTDVSNLTLTITTTGRTIMAYLTHDTNVTSIAQFSNVNSDSNGAGVLVRVYDVDNGTSLGDTQLFVPAGQQISIPVPMMLAVATPAAGAHNYKVQVRSTSTNTSWYIERVRFYVVEL